MPSETRRRQEQYVQRRRGFLAWTGRQVDVFGAMWYRDRTKTYTTVQFQNLHPALKVTIPDSGISISVSIAGQTWDVLVDFDFAPKRVTGGYLDAMNLSEWLKTASFEFVVGGFGGSRAGVSPAQRTLEARSPSKMSHG
jgi:hypothetical protein